ncbi:predicted protein [Histoplasma capsulatum var. duboisii H88]|uniref:Predicted protein n=2 Tax=Ajellomyces capsulatus TaxID=5037 RepID=F0UCL1_AJEC8|nr:predicted protein [Histoplasma capsulatum H143]EGC43287.1 predicted protein [Histoplasma capsulatum var. duboisii H88]
MADIYGTGDSNKQQLLLAAPATTPTSITAGLKENKIRLAIWDTLFEELLLFPNISFQSTPHPPGRAGPSAHGLLSSPVQSKVILGVFHLYGARFGGESQKL